MKNSIQRKFPGKAGFTLSEILIAMLVFAIAITTILALLARSIEAVDEIVLKDEAMRLSGTVEAFMSDIPFNDAYRLVRQNHFLHTFVYAGDPNAGRSHDGTMRQIPGDPPNFASLTAGEDFVPFPAVWATGRYTAPNGNSVNETISARIAGRTFPARTGRYFHVRLSISGTNPIPAGSLPPNPDDYESAVLVVFAEFFPANTPPRNDQHPEARFNQPGARSAYSYNFAVRR